MDNKKRVGIISSSLLVRTGFSNHLRALLPYLYSKNKYELFHLNQGMGDTPDFQRFPWKNFGVFQNGTFDTNRFQSSDEGYKRHVSYGNLAVEKFILDNKLNVVIHIEDIWSSSEESYLKSKWWSHLKDNFLQWTTADSLPILPNFKTWAENCDNMWFWTSFAEKSLKEEDNKKYGHTATVHGCLGTKDYFPIMKHEKDELRKRNNIDKDTHLFFQLGRSQLRKLYPQTIESFSKFKKRNPNIKAKLLFHCSVQEGWPFERLIQESKLDKSDVLFSYFCLNCGQWEVKPYEGEFKDCKYCGVQGLPPQQHNSRGNGQKTAGIDSTISNSEMSKIYGMCDASISVFTSGGQENFSVESLLCGLPLLCTDYSCGTDFTCNDFVFPLDGTFTYEVGTGFKKHVPNINTMVKFYEKICSMSEDKKKDISKRGREWALKTFDVSVVGKKLEDWIDSRKPIEWDYSYKIEPKDPNAQIENIPDNSEFIKQCYKKILNMEVSDDDSGKKYWEQFLSDSKNTRDQMVQYMRGVAVQENQSNNVKHVDFSESLIKNNKKNLLIVLREAIGDIILSTSLLESFRKNYPSDTWNIYYATKPEYFEILAGNQNIDKLLPIQDFMDNEILCTGAGKHVKGYFDAYCSLGANAQKFLNYLTNDKIHLPCNN